MKWALLLLFSLPAHAETEAKCLKALAGRMGHSEAKFAENVMTCNLVLMGGFALYLDGGKYVDKEIRRRHPAKCDEGQDCPVTQMEKADRLLMYNQCEEIAHHLSKYMKECTATKENRLK